MSFAGLVTTLLVGGQFALNRPKRAASRPTSSLKNRQAARKQAVALPLYFERNLGQSDPQVRYLSHTSRSSLFLTDDSAVITMAAGAIHKGPQTARFRTLRIPRTSWLNLRFDAV
jgi:hypothetical protein